MLAGGRVHSIGRIGLWIPSLTKLVDSTELLVVFPSRAAFPNIFPRKRGFKEIFATRKPYPFSDKYFDFVVCSHTLEDIRDPLWVCSELIRIGKRGYIEVPSREHESSRGVERPGMAGLSHHRWLVEINHDMIRFIPKFGALHSHWKYSFPSRFGRSLGKEGSVQSLWWTETFRFEEVQIHGLEAIEKLLQEYVQSVRPYPKMAIIADRLCCLLVRPGGIQTHEIVRTAMIPNESISIGNRRSRATLCTTKPNEGMGSNCFRVPCRTDRCSGSWTVFRTAPCESPSGARVRAVHPRTFSIFFSRLICDLGITEPFRISAANRPLKGRILLLIFARRCTCAEFCFGWQVSGYCCAPSIRWDEKGIWAP